MMLILVEFEELSGHRAPERHTGYAVTERTLLVMDSIVVMRDESEQANLLSMQHNEPGSQYLSTFTAPRNSKPPSTSQKGSAQPKKRGRPPWKVEQYQDQPPETNASMDITMKKRKRRTNIELDAFMTDSMIHEDDWITSVKTRGQLKILETIISEPEPKQIVSSGFSKEGPRLLDTIVVSISQIVSFRRYMLINSFKERMIQSIHL